MKISALALTFAIGAVAQPNNMVRSASTITDVLASVYTAMTDAHNKLVTYKAGASSEDARKASINLIKLIKDKTPTLQSTDPLTHEEVVGIKSVSIQLSTVGTMFLEELSSAVPGFASRGICEKLYQYIVHLGKHSYSAQKVR